jgi:hypothetical protein
MRLKFFRLYDCTTHELLDTVLELYKITHRGLPDALQKTQTQQLGFTPQIHHSIKSTCPPAMLMSARDL